MEEQGEVTHRFWAVSHADRIAGGHRRRRAVVAGHRVQPHPPRRRPRCRSSCGKAGVRAEAIHGDRSQSQRERALGAVRPRRRARARRHRRRRPRHPRRRRRLRAAVRPAGRPTRTTSTAPAAPVAPARPGTVITLRPAGEGEGRAQDAARAASPRADRGGDGRHRRLRPGVDAARSRSTAATISTASAVGSGPGPVDRVADLGRPASTGRRKAHRKGASPRQVSEGDWTPRAKPGKPAAAKGRNGQERAGAPARSGRPGAKPGRRPAGAGAARPGRPAGGNGRRRCAERLRAPLGHPGTPRRSAATRHGLGHSGPRIAWTVAMRSASSGSLSGR